MSSSKSSQSSRQSTQQTDNRIGVEAAEGSTVQTVGGSSNQVTFTDQGALAIGEAISLAGIDTVQELLDIVEAGGDRLLTFSENTVGGAVDALQQARDTEGANLSSTLIKFGLPIAGVVAIFYFMRKG